MLSVIETFCCNQCEHLVYVCSQKTDPEQDAALKKKMTFGKFTYCGVDLDQQLDVTYEQLMGLIYARARRRLNSQEVGIKLCVAETNTWLLLDYLMCLQTIINTSQTLIID